MRATIFEIKRFAVHDGDGIRTTIFFKGCPLKCVWCHNPEGISFKPQISYLPHKCIRCEECVKACKSGAHAIGNGRHIFYREKCIGCGACEVVCLGEALKLYGKEMTVEELMPILLEDKDFYENSGGGVTLSGGECLMQADFCAELLKKLNENGIHTAVDTCGFVSREAIDKVMPYTDIFLYDVKAFDEETHIKCTGQSNKIILDNLQYIDACGKKIEIRIPYVPEYNSGQMEKIAEFLRELKHLTKVRVLPYHNYAGSKYEALDMKNTLPERVPDEADLKRANMQMIERKKMDLAEIDKNLAVDTTISREGLRFYDVEEEPFRVYGVYKDGGMYRRLPAEDAARVSDKVYALHTFTAGGRVRFVTDSPYVAIKTDYTANRKPHFPLTASGGFDMYAECMEEKEHYVGTFIPPYDVTEGFESVVDFEEQKERMITIHFPLYSEVRMLCIGLKDGSVLKKAPDYRIEKPVVFYGSSITQGGGASRPGNNYENIISRHLNCNHINLGFSGSARGEVAMAEYISKLDMSVFVLDYDHNSGTEELRSRHNLFFKIVREAQPDLPIIILPRPRYYLKKDDTVRREIVYKTYQEAIKAGDKNVYFIGGEKLMELAKGEGSVDYTHPNDFGFHSMARALEEVLKEIM